MSGSYSLKVSAQSHFEIMRVFEINQTLTSPTQFRVSFDVQLSEIQNSKYQGNTTLYTYLIVEFDDGSQVQVYTSKADNISQEPGSIHLTSLQHYLTTNILNMSQHTGICIC
ncbi:hypothetical protein [Pseudoalteromonas luteoviolacea]|uniref:Uncharacterized protein n=1 Tax=Pseudoalteromonas luteoviolacea NCIMB 1942 TaxID=1365253 RepID=A0A167I2R3_9GAMM|nr:hypothetical protein [Pseudoalteromonas luteoviolacea]KZN58823.1 hypothetical protein N482_00115 [Pseudoalteromonas luteoviolacea NCIMB 1942]